MKNVTIRNETGERVGFYRNFPTNEAEQIKIVREDIGPGVYKVCYQKSGVKIDKETGKSVRRSWPTKSPLYVDTANAAGRRTIISTSYPADVRSGTQPEIARTIENLIEAIQTIDQNVSDMREELSDIRAELFEDDDDETGEGTPPEKQGMAEKLAGIALNPKYQSLISGLMQGEADPDAMAGHVGSEIQKNPTILRDLVMELMQ